MAAEDPQATAEAVREAMLARDLAVQSLGIEVVEIGPGLARCRMRVREDMLNTHGNCHGGLIFALADTAFGFACNACNRRTVSQAAEISYTAPAARDDVLIASAKERVRSRRTGVYDVEVARADGAIIALFRAHAYEIGGAVLAAPADQTG